MIEGCVEENLDYCIFGVVDGIEVVAIVRSCLISCLLIHRKFTFRLLD